MDKDHTNTELREDSTPLKALTPQQIKNWRLAFPEMAFFSDDQVQRLRDNLQGIVNRGSEASAHSTSSDNVRNPNPEVPAQEKGKEQ